MTTHMGLPRAMGRLASSNRLGPEIGCMVLRQRRDGGTGGPWKRHRANSETRKREETACSGQGAHPKRNTGVSGQKRVLGGPPRGWARGAGGEGVLGLRAGSVEGKLL